MTNTMWIVWHPNTPLRCTFAGVRGGNNKWPCQPGCVECPQCAALLSPAASHPRVQGARSCVSIPAMTFRLVTCKLGHSSCVQRNRYIDIHHHCMCCIVPMVPVGRASCRKLCPALDAGEIRFVCFDFVTGASPSVTIVNCRLRSNSPSCRRRCGGYRTASATSSTWPSPRQATTNAAGTLNSCRGVLHCLQGPHRSMLQLAVESVLHRLIGYLPLVARSALSMQKSHLCVAGCVCWIAGPGDQHPGVYLVLHRACGRDS